MMCDNMCLSVGCAVNCEGAAAGGVVIANVALWNDFPKAQCPFLL